MNQSRNFTSLLNPGYIRDAAAAAAAAAQAVSQAIANSTSRKREADGEKKFSIL